jgi:hypothetical protein
MNFSLLKPADLRGFDQAQICAWQLPFRRTNALTPGNVIAKRFQALVKSVLSEVELRHVFLDDLDKLSGAVKRCGR